MKYINILIIMCIIGFGIIAWSSNESSTINVQGVLRNPNTGDLLPDDSYNMTFKIYKESDGTVVWSEYHQSIEVNNGVYNANLGSVDDFSGVPFDVPYLIGVSVGGTEMSPRIPLTSSPYALSVYGADNKFPASGNVIVGGTLAIVGFTNFIKFDDNTTLNSADFSFDQLAAADKNPDDALKITTDKRVKISPDASYPDTCQLYIKNHTLVNGNVSTVSSDTTVTKADTINIKGNLTFNGSKPFVLESYNDLSTDDNEHYHNTNYLFSEWSAAVVGYTAGTGDLEEDEEGENSLVVKVIPDGDPAEWHLVLKFRAEDVSGKRADWQADVLFIRREMVDIDDETINLQPQ